MEDVQEVSEGVKDLSISARRVQEEVLISMRGSIEHFKYATPRVQLAWGFHSEEERIRHVTAVNNGLKCACICPACREGLVSRQGQVKAWHFAHHDGKECRNAVSAAMAKFLAQWLSDGNGLDLPKVTYTYGGKRHSRPARKAMVFDRAAAKEDPTSKAWEVLAEVDVDGQVSKMRVLIRTNPRMNLPSKEYCRDSNVSTMVIDLGSVLSVALEIEPDLCTDEKWLTSQVVSEAPREWMWTAASDRLRKSAIDKNVGPYLAAIETAKRKVPVENTPSPAQSLIEFMGYDAFVNLPKSQNGEDVPGTFIFSRSPQNWRSEIFLDLILKSLARSFPNAPKYEDTVIGWRQTGACCRRKTLIPSLFLRKVDTSTLLELSIAHPDFSEPVKVIDKYLEELARVGVLRSRPRRRNDAWQTDIYDPDLKFMKGGSHSISPAFIKHLKDHLEKYPADRDAILKGRPPQDV